MPLMSIMPLPDSSRRRAVKALVAGAASAAAGAFAQSDGPWKPAKPIRFIVGFSAGGSADTLARLIAVPMAQKLGTQVVVENIPGAGANIAMTTLSRAAPDGLTIGMGAPGTHAISPAMLGAKMPYRVPQDFTPITLLVTQPNVLIMHSKLGVANMAEFIAWIKANPAATYGSAGIGTSNHLCGELLSQRLGAKLTHVAYKGAPQVITDLLGGHIDMTFDNITTAAVLVRENKVRGIAVTTARRSANLPELPTLAEAGLPGYDLASWQGLFAPRGIAAPVQQALYDAAAHALADADVRRRLADFGSEPGGQSPEGFAAYLMTEMKRWGDIVRSAKINPE